jgi:hypothetical protein
VKSICESREIIKLLKLECWSHLQRVHSTTLLHNKNVSRVLMLKFLTPEPSTRQAQTTSTPKSPRTSHHSPSANAGHTPLLRLSLPRSRLRISHDQSPPAPQSAVDNAPDKFESCVSCATLASDHHNHHLAPAAPYSNIIFSRLPHSQSPGPHRSPREAAHPH